MKRYLLNTLFITSTAIATQAAAVDLNQVADTLNAAANTANAAQNTANAIEGKNDGFTQHDRKLYKAYYEKHPDQDDDNNHHTNNGHNKQYNSLPPGLQKKVDSGKSLPPGWQKKVANGQVFSPELRNYSKRSPYPSPKGTSTYILEDKVIRVLDSTNVILDVLTN